MTLEIGKEGRLTGGHRSPKPVMSLGLPLQYTQAAAQEQSCLLRSFLWFQGPRGSSIPVGSQDSTGLLLLERVGGSWDAHKEGVALGLLRAELQQICGCLGHLQANQVRHI